MSKVITLYKLQFGDTQFRWSSVEEDIVYNEEVYTKEAVRRSERGCFPEMQQNAVKIIVAADNPVVLGLLNSSLVDTQNSVTIFETNEDSYSAVWKGRVSSYDVTDYEATLNCESVLVAQRRNALRRLYQRPCPYAVYADGCRLDMEDFAIAATVATISGKTITSAVAAGYDNGWFSGGMVKHNITGILRYVVSHTGSQLILRKPFPSIDITDAVSLYPGCPHTKAACLDKFNNLNNYGGFPWMPTKNPFGLTSLV